MKYSAEQLKKKGVLTNLDSVPLEQQHNIEFEISARETNGRFCVKCRFMGVEVDTADIDIQVCFFTLSLYAGWWKIFFSGLVVVAI